MPDFRTRAARWMSVKESIRQLQDELAAIEGELLEEVESVEGGSKTTRKDGFKVVVKRPINRTIDGEAWERVKDRIPVGLWPVRAKVEPDTKGCEWMARERPDLWAIAAEAITEKPGKPGFTVEEASDD